MNGVKRVKAAYSIFSAVLIAFGLFIAIYSDISLQIAYKIGGVIFLGFGITKIVGYFSKDLFQLAFQHDLAMGVVSILVGVIMFFKTEDMIRLHAILIGLFLIVDALLKVQTSIDAKKIGIRDWWFILVIGLSAAVIGVLLFLEPFHGTRVMVRFVGIMLLIDGILNLYVVQNTVSTIKKRNSSGFFDNKKDVQ